MLWQATKIHGNNLYYFEGLLVPFCWGLDAVDVNVRGSSCIFLAVLSFPAQEVRLLPAVSVLVSV